MTESNKMIKDGYLNLEMIFTGELSGLIAKSFFGGRGGGSKRVEIFCRIQNVAGTMLNE